MAGAGGFFQGLVSRPGVSISVSFILAIFIGAGFLNLPQATVDRKGLPFVDALFIATSATCVTGLTVCDPNKLSYQYFSFWIPKEFRLRSSK